MHDTADRKRLTAARDRLMADARAILSTADKDRRALAREELERYEDLMDQADAIGRTLDSAPHARATTAGTDTGDESSAIGTPRASWLERRAVSAGTDALGGFFVNPTYAGTFVANLVLRSPVLGELRRIVVSGERLVIPAVAADPATAWVAEAAQLTPVDPTYGVVTLTPKKLTSFVVASNESLEDSSPALRDVLAFQFERAAALALEAALFEGAGGNAPVGLKSVAGISTVTTLGDNGGTPADLDAFADALATLIESGAAPDRLRIVMHPRTWKTLLKIKTATGSNKALLQSDTPGVGGSPVGAIYGVPTRLSSRLSVTETRGSSSDTSSAYVFDVDQVVFAPRSEVRLEADRSFKFDYDQTAFRLVQRADFGVLNAAGVARIVGFRP